MSGIMPRGSKAGDYYYLWAQFNAQPNGTLYYLPGTTDVGSTTETDRDLVVDFGFLLRRFRAHITSNAATGDTVVAFRLNAVTQSSITFATTVTGQVASGVVSRPIVAGQLIDFSVDVTDGAANTVSGMLYAVCERTPI